VVLVVLKDVVMEVVSNMVVSVEAEDVVVSDVVISVVAIYEAVDMMSAVVLSDMLA
jgi:hypothetical protein